MAEQNSAVESVGRDVAADRLSDIASALRSGDECVVRVGNKNITLSPSDTVNYRIDVTEKQRRFRGSRETVRIELDWKPRKED